MGINNIKNVSGLITFISENSSWSPVTVSNVVSALGYRKNGGLESLKNLSSNLVDCAKHGANGGFTGFSMYYETVKFFRENRRDITRNIELTAKIIGKDTVKMVQGFGVYRGQCPPSVPEILRALSDTSRIHGDLSDLYNVFAWFCLEDVSNIWYRYLDNHYPFYASLTLTA
jgi:hypothetical protein